MFKWIIDSKFSRINMNWMNRKNRKEKKIPKSGNERKMEYET